MLLNSAPNEFFMESSSQSSLWVKPIHPCKRYAMDMNEEASSQSEKVLVLGNQKQWKQWEITLICGYPLFY
jgi:hypothetical protein